MVGIQRGGVPLGQRLGALLTGIWGQPVPTGSLDVSMHRDDLDRRVAPNVQPTVIPFDVTGKTVVLVDDVLFSGRTIRAAMDALNDFGRPRRIQLAVLIDRGHRELPIKADFVGKNVPTAHTERVRVRLDGNGRRGRGRHREMKQERSNGVMECWSDGAPELVRFPSLHHSITPSLPSPHELEPQTSAGHRITHR